MYLSPTSVGQLQVIAFNMNLNQIQLIVWNIRLHYICTSV